MKTEKKTRVLVLCGGRSAEHEISILSARFVLKSLDPARFLPVVVGIGKSNGRWFCQTAAELLALPADARRVAVDETAPELILEPVPAADGTASLVRTDGSRSRVDVVFPVLHGPFGEDGCVQGLLELCGVPYVGSGVLGCAAGMDKVVMKQLFEQAELPVLPYRWLRRHDFERHGDELLGEAAALGLPLFVKPANMGSSVGVSKVSEPSALRAAVEHAFTFDTKVVVEKGLQGARELECAVLGNDDPRASTVGEIVVKHRDGFYSYDAKYLDDSGAELCIPAPLHHAELSVVQLLALRAFRVLDCAGLGRVDLFMDQDRNIYLNEVNTMPGFTAISMYPRLWAASGLAGQALVSELIDLAFQRAACKRALHP